MKLDIVGEEILSSSSELNFAAQVFVETVPTEMILIREDIDENFQSKCKNKKLFFYA